MGKTCNGDCYCEHKCLGPVRWVCNYNGYCDFQAPRDSRNNDIPWNGLRSSNIIIDDGTVQQNKFKPPKTPIPSSGDPQE